MHESIEIVHTVIDYYDGPRSGIANYGGKPHLYNAVFDNEIDEWSDIFLLQPVDDETFRLAMEDWAIWCRWERAYHAGQTPDETHPALPDERARHDQLEVILKTRLQIDPKRAIRVTGQFKPFVPGQTGISSSCKLGVAWSLDGKET